MRTIWSLSCLTILLLATAHPAGSSSSASASSSSSGNAADAAAEEAAEEAAAGDAAAEAAAEEAARSLVWGAATAGASGESAVTAAVHIVSPVRVATPEALRSEVVAAEAALALRAEVDGAPVVYDSPSVSISLRKVSPHVLVKSGAKIESVDGAAVTIPADPRIKGRHGGPVTVTVTSYHTGDKIKEVPTVKYGANREYRTVGGPDAISAKRHKEDRVDFFMTKTSVSWRGTVNVKVPGLGAQVPAHDRPWTPYGVAADAKFPEEKEKVRTEAEHIASLPDAGERSRGFRQLARQWHPDKNPEDLERATEVFAFLQELREALLPSSS